MGVNHKCYMDVDIEDSIIAHSYFNNNLYYSCISVSNIKKLRLR